MHVLIQFHQSLRKWFSFSKMLAVMIVMTLGVSAATLWPRTAKFAPLSAITNQLRKTGFLKILPPTKPSKGAISSSSLTQTTFTETFNNAPDYSNNWVIAGQTGTSTTTYTSGNFRIQAPPVCTGPTSGTGVIYRSKQAFAGDLDASFQLNHGGYGRTSVGLWSVKTNQLLLQAILDTDDTAYLNFGSGTNFTEYKYSSGPYLNKWITLRIQVVGSNVNFYADNGTGLQLLQTWPVPAISSDDSYHLAFGAASVCWKSGANDTSFRLITATGTPKPSTPSEFVFTGVMKDKRVFHTATLLKSGLVLVTGGYNGTTALHTAELYDPQTKTWRYTKTMMNAPRDRHTATLLQDGRVLIVGGLPETNTAEIYDPATETFSSIKPMNVTRFLHRAILFKDGRVLVIAGRSSSRIGAIFATNAAEIFDPLTGNWSLTDSLPFAVTDHTATLLPDGKVLVAGGYDGNINDAHVASVALYDPATGKWKSMTPMQVRRTSHTATLLTNGKVLIAGGNNTFTTIDSTEIYDPNAGANGQSTLGNAVKVGGWGSRAERLNDGNALLIGGEFLSPGIASPTNAAQVFNATTGAVTDVGPMNAARAYATVTLLPSGQVLIAGGQEASGVPLASAEIWAETCIAPTITAQPIGKTISSGEQATLTVGASGTEPRSYQWYEGAKGDTSKPVGTNARSFTTPALTASKSYWVQVSNSCGSRDSETVTVQVSVVKGPLPIALIDANCESQINCTGSLIVKDLRGNKVSLVSDPVRLAAASVTRTGAVADGVTLLLLRVESQTDVTFTLNVLSGNTEKGVLMLPDGSAEATSFKVSPQVVNGKKYAFIAYRAPIDFPEQSSIVSVTASSVTNEGQKPIQLVRPPVMLVHGVWSNDYAWKGLDDYLSKQGYRTFRLDYSLPNSAPSFDPRIDNIPVIRLNNITKHALKILRLENIAITQVDVVGHSMGGLVARSRVASRIKPYLRQDNFYKGDFHKIITVGTPHLGTPLADFLLNHRCDVIYKSSNNSLTLEQAFAEAGRPISDAIYGFQSVSSSIEAIGGTNVASHAIVGIEPDVTSTTEKSLNVLIKPIGSLRLDDIFAQPNVPGEKQHDTIVPINSQKGGLPEKATSNIAQVVHANLQQVVGSGGKFVTGCATCVDDIGETDSSAVWNRVQQILQSPVKSDKFAFFPPFKKPQGTEITKQACATQRLTEFSSFSNKSNSPFLDSTLSISITPAQGASVNPGDTVTVNFSVTGGNATSGAVFSFAGNLITVDGPGPYSASFQISSENAGQINIAAFTYGDGPDNYAASTYLSVKPRASLVSVSAALDNPTLQGIGDLARVLVIGSFSDGSKFDLTASGTGTTYRLQSGGNNVASVTTEGLVEAKGGGQDAIVISNSGKATVLPIAVNAGNPIPTITNLIPSAIPVQSPEFTLTVNGTNFFDNSIVYFNGNPRPTTFVSANILTAQIIDADLVTIGTATITVFNPSPGGGGAIAGLTINDGNTYEADVSPRPSGNKNGSVTIADWVQLGRFAAGIDTPEIGSEFQRADCAPKPTFGDGKITISDWVQAGRYGAGLDPVVSAGGTPAPVSSLNNLAGRQASLQAAANSTASEIRIGQAAFGTSATVTIPVEIVATGTENAIGFSLTYDPALLSNPVAVLGTDATAASLIINPNDVASGRLGVALGLPAGQAFPAGIRQLLRVTFSLTPASLGKTTTVGFGNAPVQQEVVDVLANPLMAAFTPADVVINNPKPVITALNPASAYAGDGTFTLGVVGTGFVSGSVVRWNGTPLVTTFQSATLLLTSVPSSLIASVGTASITVANPAPGGTESDPLIFSILNPVPSLTGLGTNSIVAGKAGTLDLTGDKFVPGSIGFFNGRAMPTRFISRTRLAIDYTAADIACAGIIRVNVTNPAPGGGTSPMQILTITSMITSLSPAEVIAGGAAFNLTINGMGFCTGARVRWNGLLRDATIVNPQQITVAVAATDISLPGTVSISVVSDDGVLSNSVSLLIKEQPFYEADVSPRPNGNGNGTVTMADWVQLGRFFVGLDTPAVGSEFQRADCAPKASLGDGAITISDWVQAGRYAAGLDVVVPAGGPTTLAILPKPLTMSELFPATEAQARTVRARNASFQRGQIGLLQIELDAQGNENAIAFSLNFDPKQMSFVDATVGAGANGAALQINRSQATDGRVGFAVVLPPGQQLLGGTRTLLNLRFIPNGGDGDVVTNINFSDQLLAREVVDANATLLPQASYIGSTITIQGRAAANVSAASYADAELAADSIASAFGTRLATITVAAASVPLPTTLGGTSVRVKDALGVERIAPLFFVSPTQINYQIPAGTADGIASVTITNGAGEVTMGLLSIARVAPGLFAADASGQGWAAAEVVSVASDGSQTLSPVARFDVVQNKFVAVPITFGPDTEQLFLVLFGTGLRYRSSLSNVTAYIGNTPIEVVYAGIQPEYIGLDQLNLRLPRSLMGRGTVEVAIAVDGKPANIVQVSFR